MLSTCAFLASSAPLFDVVVYGASPSGISAAITAANGTGLRVALLEPSPFVGGMSGPGGIGLRDTASPAAIDGASPLSVQAHWLRLVNAAYGAKVSGVRAQRRRGEHEQRRRGGSEAALPAHCSSGVA